MAVEIQERANGKVLTVQATGKLTREDYDYFLPIVERLIREHGKLRILFDMKKFRGWTGSALWQDLKFDIKHFRDIDRLAVVGDKAWQHGMALFCRPFTTATIRYFDRSQTDQAIAWIEDGLSVRHPSSAFAT
jgi:hypothetical protein